MDVTTAAALLGVPTSVGFVAAVARKFFRFTNRLEEALKPDALGRSISERLDATQIQVAEIKKQVLPNGGGSLRDAVNDAAALAATARDRAAAAAAAAKEAADRADRAEIMGNYERRDIRHKLESIEAKMDTAQATLTTHLVEAAAKTEQINSRLDKIERKPENRP